MSKICSNCAQELDDSISFCGFCGNRVDQTAAGMQQGHEQPAYAPLVTGSQNYQATSAPALMPQHTQPQQHPQYKTQPIFQHPYDPQYQQNQPPMQYQPPMQSQAQQQYQPPMHYEPQQQYQPQNSNTPVSMNSGNSVSQSNIKIRPAAFWLCLVAAAIIVILYFLPWAYFNTYGWLDQRDTSISLLNLYGKLDDVCRTLEFYGGYSSGLETAKNVSLALPAIALTSIALLVVAFVLHTSRGHSLLVYIGFGLAIIVSAAFVILIYMINTEVKAVMGVNSSIFSLFAFPIVVLTLALVSISYFVQMYECRSIYVRDMTKGSVVANILKIAIPILILLFIEGYSSIVETVFAMMNGIYITSAIGAANFILRFPLSVFSAVSIAVTIMVSQFIGRRDRENLNKIVGNSAFITICTAVLLTVIGLVFYRLVARWVANDEIVEGVSRYLRIALSGLILFAFYHISFGILRGFGDVVFPTAMLLLTVLGRVGLSILFTEVHKMHIVGLSLSSVISMLFLSSVYLVRIAQYSRRGFIDLGLRYLKPDKTMLLRMMKLVLPLIAVQLIVIFGSSLINNVIYDGLDYYYWHTRLLAQNANSSYILPISSAISITAVVFIGQNVGAGLQERINSGRKAILMMSIVFSTATVIPFILLCQNINNFLSYNDDFYNYIPVVLPFVALSNIAVFTSSGLCGVYQGTGTTLPTMWNTIIVYGTNLVAAFMIKFVQDYGIQISSASIIIAPVLGLIIVLLYSRIIRRRTLSSGNYL